MDPIALHLEVRNAFALSDELGRHEHALHNDAMSGHLAATRTALAELERELGRSHARPMVPNPVLVDTLRRALDTLRERMEEVPSVLRPRVAQLMASLERVVFAELRPASPIPAKPLFGVLPLRRAIPQDVHSVMDYVSAAAYALSAKLALTDRGRAVGLALGTSVAGVSLLTDYHLSAAKVIPIELHELLDHATGASAIAAPFVLGYVKRDPVAAAIQIATGVGVVLASLFTDYRAVRGVGRARRSRGGPMALSRRRNRVPDVQRPLEGLSAPSAPERSES
jgi:hypothetical protein